MKHLQKEMIWGGMSKSGTIMIGAMYVDQLQEKLEHHMHIHQCTIEVHEAVPCTEHKSVKIFGNGSTLNISLDEEQPTS